MSDGGFAGFANLPLISGKDLFSDEIFDTKYMNEEEKEKVKEFSAQYKILMEYGNYEDAIECTENFYKDKSIRFNHLRFLFVSYANIMLGKFDEAIKNCDDGIAGSMKDDASAGQFYYSKSYALFEKNYQKMDKISSWKKPEEMGDEAKRKMVEYLEGMENSRKCILMAEKILGFSVTICVVKTPILLYSIHNKAEEGAIECVNKGLSICEDDSEKMLLLKLKASVYGTIGPSLNKESQLRYKEEVDRCEEKLKELEKAGAKPYVVGSKARNKEKENE